MKTTPPWKPSILLWLLSVATAAVVSLLVSDVERPAPASAVSVVATPDTALLEVQAELAALKRDLTLLRIASSNGTEVSSEPLAMPLSGEPVAQEETNDELGSLDDRISLLEQYERERQRALAEKKEEKEQEKAERLARNLERRDEAQAVILDPARSDSKKVKAWRDLGDLDVDGAWNDAIVLEMVRIGTQSEDTSTRADVWRGADSKHRNSLLPEPLLHALQSDPKASVRREAADALSRYSDQASVQAMLRAASELDLDKKVRKEASRALPKTG